MPGRLEAQGGRSEKELILSRLSSQQATGSYQKFL